MSMDVLGADVIPDLVSEDATCMEQKLNDEKIMNLVDDQKLPQLLNDSNEEITANDSNDMFVENDLDVEIQENDSNDEISEIDANDSKEDIRVNDSAEKIRVNDSAEKIRENDSNEEIKENNSNKETSENISNEKVRESVSSEEIRKGNLCEDTEVIKNVDRVMNSTVPKDPLNEWPASKQIHTFSFVRHRHYEDPKLKAKFEQAEKEIQKKTQARTQMIKLLKAKRAERADIISQLKPLQNEQNQFWEVMSEKRKEMKPLQAALGKLHGLYNGAVEKGVTLCSSEKELNQLIESLQYRIEHEIISLPEEKQLLKQIRQLKASRGEVIAKDAMRAKIHESFGQRDAIQNQVKLIGADLDGVRKEKQAIGTKINHLKEKRDIVNEEIDSMNMALDDITANRENSYQALVMLRIERDNSNACFFQYRSFINNVKNLAAKKDITALKELAHSEVEDFMFQWNRNKDFREDYKRRLSSSLDARVLCRDGRMRNPDEKPILSEATKAGIINEKEIKIQAAVSTEAAETDTMKEKENKIHPRIKCVINNVEEQVTAKPIEAVSRRELPDTENTDPVENSKNESSTSYDFDPLKLKEIKIEGEIAKSKRAVEKKKRKSEKTAAEASARAQKKAEKKHKKKEKKARKKAVALLHTAETVEHEEAETEQHETQREDVEKKIRDEANVNAEALVRENSVEQPKEKPTSRSRRQHRSKVGRNQIPKTIKSKTSFSSWLWAVPAAICAFLIAIFGYYYYIGKSQ